MSELLTLREAGIDYPDISILRLIRQRLADAREFKRNMRRAKRLQAGRYAGWTFVVPEHFQQFTIP